MRSTIHLLKETIMDDAQTQGAPEAPQATEPQPEIAPTRLQIFVNKHPRAAKVLAIIGVVTTVAGGVHFTRTLKANKEHLELAGDHASAALDELAASTSPDPSTEA